MNENPGGTPNPLNPNPGTVPAGAGPVPPAQPAQPAPAPAQPAATPVQPAVVPTQPVATAPAQPAMPAETLAEPSTKGSVVEPAKKSKKSVVIAVILLLLAAIGGGVAAFFFLNPFKGDAVPMALQKLIGDGKPENISVDGTIKMSSSDENSAAQGVEIALKSGFSTTSANNYLSAKVNASLDDDSDFSFDIDEIHTANGNLYFKISNITDAIEELIFDAGCVEGEDGNIICQGESETFTTTASVLSTFNKVFGVIDGNWIYAKDAELSGAANFIQANPATQCIIDAADKMGNYSDDFSKLYQDNPFVTYSTENLKIAQKKNQLYALSFDVDKLTSFLNSMSTAGLINDLMACSGGNAVSTVSREKVADLVDQLPEIYAEIDNDYNFTRVYLEFDDSENKNKIVADLSFSYPTSLNINEPTEYIPINDVVKNVFETFGMPVTDYTFVTGEDVEEYDDAGDYESILEKYESILQ